MARLTPPDLINLMISGFKKYQVNPAAVMGEALTFRNGLDESTKVTITAAEYERRVLLGASIMYAESGGNTDAVNVNGPGTSKPGSRDRGLWQWNNEYAPDVSDMAAFDPTVSTDIALRKTRFLSTTSPYWTGSRGLDPNSEPSKAVRAAYESMLGRAVDDTPVLSDIDPDANGIPDVVESLVDWTTGLSKLLSVMTSAAFWKRVGTGALGVAITAGVVILVARETIGSTITQARNKAGDVARDGADAATGHQAVADTTDTDTKDDDE